MAWSPDGPAVTTLTRQGWTPDGPDPVAVESRRGWTWVPQAVGEDIIRLGDLSTVSPATAGRDLLALADRGVLAPPALVGVDQIVLRDSALATPAVNGQDGIQLGDRGTLGVYGAESLAFGDLGVAAPATSGRDILALGDRSVVATATAGSDLAALGDSGTGGFSAHAEATTIITASATFTIPVWAYWLDLIAVGGGAGGQGAGWVINGTGGKAGSWAAVRLVRGVDIPWTTVSLSVVVGAGGTLGAGGASPSSGGPGGASAVTGYLTAAGGANSAGTGQQFGLSPGNYTFQGVTYVGGAESNGIPANYPGSGGKGGTAFSGNGGAGGRGQVWVRAGQ